MYTHTELHRSLDILVGCWAGNAPGNCLYSEHSIMELMEWSYKMVKLEEQGSPTPCLEKLTNRL